MLWTRLQSHAEAIENNLAFIVEGQLASPKHDPQTHRSPDSPIHVGVRRRLLGRLNLSVYASKPPQSHGGDDEVAHCTYNRQHLGTLRDSEVC